MTPRPLLEIGTWRVAMAEGTGNDLVLAFASIGHDPARPPSPEFVASAGAANRRALFFMDDSRSWGLDPGFPAVLRAGLAAVGPVRRTMAIGASMGAATALRAAIHVPIDTILAIGPQSRLDDPRWVRWTERLGDPGPPPLPSGTWTILMHGLQDDREQAMGFPQADGTDHLLFPNVTHSGLAPHLKQRGLLTGLMDAALNHDRRRALRILQSAGGVQRRKGMPA